MDSTAAYICSLLKERRPPLFTALNSFSAYGIASRYHLKEALLAARLILECVWDFAAQVRVLQTRIAYRELISSGCGSIVPMHHVVKDSIDQMIENEDDAPSTSASCSELVNVGEYGTQAEELQAKPRWRYLYFLHRAADQPSPKTITDRKAFERAREVYSRLFYEARVDNTICAAVGEKLEVATDQVRIACPSWQNFLLHCTE